MKKKNTPKSAYSVIARNKMDSDFMNQTSNHKDINKNKDQFNFDDFKRETLSK